MKAAKNHVTFGFWRGADLDDEQGLLEGTGDKMRHIKIRKAGDVRSAAFKKLINQAVKLNKDDGDPSMKKTGKAVVKKKAAATKAAPTNQSKKTTGQAGTRENPWTLKTPSGQSEFTAYRDETLDPPAVVVQVGKTQLRYHLRCIDDLYAMLKKRGDWMLLGSADEQKPAKAGTVEEWARSSKNPVRGWYGLKKGFRGRFANYVPPILKELGLAEVEEQSRNNRMRAS
jgi:hypothetical protein